MSLDSLLAFPGFSIGPPCDPNYQQRAVLAGLLPRHMALSLLPLRPPDRRGNPCCPSLSQRTLVRGETNIKQVDADNLTNDNNKVGKLC
jgi:hypothetical protein